MENLYELRTKFNRQQREILTTIWQHWIKDSHWIPVRALHAAYGGKATVLPVLQQFGGTVVYETEENALQYYGLTFLGVLLSSKGERVEDLLANYIRLAQRLALQDPNRTSVSSQDALSHLSLDFGEVIELGCAIFLSPFLSSGSHGTREWNAGLPKEIEDIPDDVHKYICERAMEQYEPDMPVLFSERQTFPSHRAKVLHQVIVPGFVNDVKGDVFVDEIRMRQIADIRSEKFDLQKLLELCRELNVCYSNECYFAVAMLTRALLDHVPPIFGFGTFAEVVDNYKSTRSFKGSMAHLNISCRKIADGHLHVSIREKEALPSKTQVNFANDVDVLLEEIVRILK